MMHLNAFVMPNGHHEAAWRHPSTDPHRARTFQHYVDIARTAERGRLDSIFLADGVALRGNVKHNSHSHFEPLTLLSALAASTVHIGLIATASTTYNEPYHLARKFASLDHLSGGRAGWNIVTSAGIDEARNFTLAKRPSHDARYDRAEEFVEVVKGRLAKYGPTPDEIKILPGISPILGRTEAEARAREAELNALIIPDYGLRQLSEMLDHDVTGYPLDGPLPDVGSFTEGGQSRFDLVVGLTRREDLTIRQLLEQLAGGRGHRVFAGTPVQVADELEAWFRGGAADGLNVMPPTLPGGLDDFVDLVVPELQRRGLFRTEYAGTTLREHYGLARPVNRNRVKEPA
ncbi:LLM class flavin-dependent oxidoreductase [Amycolatopsis sp. CA-128772]|uniref:LLM class flavin-dependent oxidoreductase n=1 Tax=Amycolatopsis sp. CA-128772 TaxID=2073159 RepID=UPI000CD0DAA1|nr:LLM class flavin-dependent oxidoreductase [Amycolatopsis sp. CA-128772]